MDAEPAKPGPAQTRRRVSFAAAILAIIALLGVAAFLLSAPGRELLGAWSVEALRDAFLRWGAWAWLASAGLMVLQALVSPLPAFVITIANGYVFGPFGGGVLALLSATLAAQICFEVARALGRPVVERWVGATALEAADRFFTRHGAWAILVARLLPFVPFDPISYAAGLTTTTRRRFLAANLVGQIPATFIYSTLGSQLEDGRLPPGVMAGLLAAAGLILTVAILRARLLASREA